MEITDIAVNPTTLEQHSMSTQMADLGFAQVSCRILAAKRFDECLEAHMTLNTYLDDQLGGSEDWGSKYANWLNSMGFEHQTDDGWWNLIAVTPENIQAFIKFWDDDEYQAKVMSATKCYNTRRFKHDMTLVDHLVEVLG